jgi:RNA polymerase sigma-70 factor (ECF subfamily)
MCTRLLRSVDASEDVTQEAFAQGFANVGSLREPEAFRSWLAAIAVNQVRRRLSRQRWLHFFGLDSSLDDASLDDLAREDLSVEARSELALLDAVLRQLPDHQRVAWMLRHVEGEPLEAVAATCECSLATAKRWIAAADKRIRLEVSIAPTEEPS